MSISFDGRKIFMCSDDVVNVDFLDIDYGTAGFSGIPTIAAHAEENDVNVFASDITNTTARLNFSTKITGRVVYIITLSE